MSQTDVTYVNYLRHIKENGVFSKDRTGVGTYSTFGYFMEYDASPDNFPILTIKQVPFKSVLAELLWFLEGSTDERRLAEITYGKDREQLLDKSTIWTANATSDYWLPHAKEYGDLGNIYGKQWRFWPRLFRRGTRTQGLCLIDQIDTLINQIRMNPMSRRHLVSAWNPSEQNEDEVALPPCHYAFQINNSLIPDTKNEYQMDMLVQMRSSDAPIGFPYNLTSYSLLLNMLAQVCTFYGGDVFKPGKVKFCIGNAHIYSDQMSAVEEILSRSTELKAPKLIINTEISDIDDFTMKSFSLDGYENLGKINMKMAV